jgi:hypothetical protein
MRKCKGILAGAAKRDATSGGLHLTSQRVGPGKPEGHPTAFNQPGGASPGTLHRLEREIGGGVQDQEESPGFRAGEDGNTEVMEDP